METTQDKHKKLAERLFARTAEKALDWKVDEWGDPYTNLADKTLFVELSENLEGQPLLLVKVADSTGDIIERFNDEQIKGLPAVGGFKNYFDLLDQLRQMAIRQSTGADKTLDELIAILDEDI